ncbi:MAG TPA: SpoIVB peptidase S55 domain-containing protein [Sandaracinaceae bacterium LLY-WYZ-13_1]|nr:SpoIVB peptidase S55 domain-containing protein [Sandaracinaceae bacterium LLY-WYZ-13_1]
MRRLVRWITPLVFGGLLVSAAAGQVRGTSDRFIHVDEIRPGMTGYGLTVFRGTQPERFDVEVIDVLHNFRPDQDLILIRTDHPVLDEAHVVAGMSGSPVYLDGRLAGAYAYGWPFSQDPVAGVTPIANMAAEMDRPIRPSAFPGVEAVPEASERAGRRVPHPSLAGLPPYTGDEPATATSALEAHAARLGIGRRAGRTLVPATTPLLVGGLSDAVVAQLDEQLGDFGLTVLQAGGGGPAQPPPGAPRRYVPGGAVGVQLVQGDIAATAVGTVTHVDGSRVAAFGHPMLNAGQTGLPTAVARVLHVLRSQARSFKISEPVRSVGTLVHDRQSGIVLDTGLQPATVDVRVRIAGVEAQRTEWNMQVASHRILTPVLLAAAINNAVQATASDNADVMFEAESRLWISGRAQPEEVVDVGYSRTGANASALSNLRLFSLLQATYGNAFEPARATRVEVDLSLRYGRDTARVLDASVAGHDVDPGSTVPVRVTLRHWDESESVRVVPVRIPERLAGDDIELFFQAGSAVRVQHARPSDLGELLRTVHERYARTDLVVSIETPARGLRFSGHVARHLPASALDTLQLRNDADRNRPFVTYDRHAISLDEVLSGTARVELHVRRTPRAQP